MIGHPRHIIRSQDVPLNGRKLTWLPMLRGSLSAFGFAFALSVAPVPAISGQNLSASDVLEACGRSSEAWISFCHGYTQATFDLSAQMGIAICPAEGTTRAMMAQAVYEGLLFLSTQVETDELEQADGAGLSAVIMSKQFPCD